MERCVSTLSSFYGSDLYVPGYIKGLEVTCDEVDDWTTDARLLPGECVSSYDGRLLTVSTALEKKFDSVWAEGDDVGGGAAVLPATGSGDYYFFLISKNADGNVTLDVCGDTDPNGSNISSSWRIERKLAADGYYEGTIGRGGLSYSRHQRGNFVGIYNANSIGFSANDFTGSPYTNRGSWQNFTSGLVHSGIRATLKYHVYGWSVTSGSSIMRVFVSPREPDYDPGQNFNECFAIYGNASSGFSRETKSYRNLDLEFCSTEAKTIYWYAYSPADTVLDQSIRFDLIGYIDHRELNYP